MSQFWYDEDTSNKLAEEIQRLAGPEGKVACLSCPSAFRACRGAKNGKIITSYWTKIREYFGLHLLQMCHFSITFYIFLYVVYLFEFDRRFKAFGASYHFYDYNHPEDLPEECHGAYSVVIADPPFLSVECLTKLAEAVKLVKTSDAKVILCTGRLSACLLLNVAHFICHVKHAKQIIKLKWNFAGDIMGEHAEKLMGLKKTEFLPKHKNNLGNEFSCFANYDFPIKSS